MGKLASLAYFLPMSQSIGINYADARKRPGTDMVHMTLMRRCRHRSEMRGGNHAVHTNLHPPKKQSQRLGEYNHGLMVAKAMCRQPLFLTRD